MAIKNVTITTDQSLFDVVLQYYGDTQFVYDFIQLNSDQIPNILFNNLKGKTLKYEEQSNIVASTYRNDNTVVATKNPDTMGATFNDAFYASIDQLFINSLEP